MAAADGHDTYRVNTPRIIHECVDGEVIAIDLQTGAYCSMRGTATFVWEALGAGRSVAEVTAVLAQDGAGHDVAGDVATFVAELVSRGLVVPGVPDDARAVGVPTTPYAAPRLEVYTDMADAILLDPIHDVDAEVGWPHLPAAEAIARIDGGE